MSSRPEIAFVQCTTAIKMIEPVAARFAAVARVLPFEASPDGTDADVLLRALAEAGPSAVVALPKVATALASGAVTAPVLPIELPPDVLLGRVEAALEEADSVAVLSPVGTVTPSTARLLRRIGGVVHIFPYETNAHLEDLVTRCRRMGVQALVGGERARRLAGEAGLQAVSFVDGPDEPAGLMGQAIVRAVGQAAPRHVGRADELARFGLILEKIAQGVIGPRDTALCVDRCGRVTAAFSPPAVHGAALALPPGISVLEAVAASAAHGAGDEDAGPVALDLYPLANGAGDGYLVVLRGAPRPTAVFPGGPAAPDAADAPVARLLERVDALVERTDALTRARRARRAPRRFLASLRRRTFLVDWDRVRYFELRSGLVYAALATGETYATNYTLADIAARVDARDFFRIHRNVIVNLNYVTELERYGVSQFRVAIEGPDTPAFVVSRPASAALRKLLKY